MKNLVFLLQKFGFVILFLVLEAVAIFLLASRGNFQKVSLINSTTGITNFFFSKYNDGKEYLYLSKENQYLLQENMELRSRLEESMRKIYPDSAFVHDTSYVQAFNYMPAKIVNQTTHLFQNYFTLDVGSNNGIKDEMGVISPSGICGVVKGVSENFSVCISVLNIKQPFSVQLAKTKDVGILQWDGKSSSYSEVRFIPSHVEIKPGDLIETSSFSGTFPEGVKVGYVTESEINPDDGYYILKIRLSTNFNALRNVYVIDYKPKKEQKKLEDSLAVQINN